MSRDRHAPVLLTLREVLEPHGWSVGYGRGGKHAYALLTSPDGWWRKYPLAGSPRSGVDHVTDWARQAAHRALVAHGCRVDANREGV